MLLGFMEWYAHTKNPLIVRMEIIITSNFANHINLVISKTARHAISLMNLLSITPIANRFLFYLLKLYILFNYSTRYELPHVYRHSFPIMFAF